MKKVPIDPFDISPGSRVEISGSMTGRVVAIYQSAIDFDVLVDKEFYSPGTKEEDRTLRVEFPEVRYVLDS